ncbi:MAG: FtsX-like permease family protein [Lentimicrobiaceae bacterium]
MIDLKLAWRNLWRNKRRTFITAASVFFAMFFALVMRSFQLGTYDRLFKNVIESYTGYLQLQNTDYFDDPILDNSFEFIPSLIIKIQADPNVIAIVQRLESFALVAAGSLTQGVMVMGIDPEGEDKVSGIKGRLVKFKLTEEAVKGLKNEPIPNRTKKLLDAFINESYTGVGRLMADLAIDAKDSLTILPLVRRHASFKNGFFSHDKLNSVLLGDGLADYLRIGIGDTIVIMGQGYHGMSAAGKYCVKGIIRVPAPDIDNRIVYMPIEAARQLYGASEIATSAVISLHNNDDDNMLLTAQRLNKKMPEQYVVRTWHELNALLINQMEADSRSGAIMIWILYLVIAFGVFGTVLMMLAERRREFGVLVAIGMQKRRLATVMSLELIMTGCLGIAAGVLVSLPVVFYGHFHPVRFTGSWAKMYEDFGFDPVMPTMLPDRYYLWQILVVVIILAITIIYSNRRIFRLKIVNALRA